MDDNLKLPECIRATRIGYYSESEYDLFGELAPVTWQCDCGKRITLERYDSNFEYYIPVPQELKDEFLAKHTACTAVCYNCHKVPVEHFGYWCDSCQD